MRFLVTTAKRTSIGSFDGHSSLSGIALAFAFLNSILAVCHLLTDADVSLDCKVAELAAFG